MISSVVRGRLLGHATQTIAEGPRFVTVKPWLNMISIYFVMVKL